MTTFADKFLRDLEELSDEEDEDLQMKGEEDEEEKGANENDEEMKEDDFAEYQEREQKVENLLAKGYQSKIRGNQQFLEHIANLDRDLSHNQQLKKYENLTKKEQVHQLIIHTNDYLKHIDNDILIVHKELRDLYATKFSELESIILNPVDYAKAVKIIGNTTDVSKVIDQLGWLSNPTLMSVTVSFSASTGRPLNDKELKEVMNICDEIINLDNAKQTMLNYLERRMNLIAPNVSAIVGTRVAAKLIAAAGGIQELSKIPACNIQVLGSQKKALNGMSTSSAQLHRGHLVEVDLFVSAPPKFSNQIIRMLATKTALAARIDACNSSTNGEEGQKLRQAICVRFDKILAPQQPKLRKPLPKPDDKPRKKRGGKKFRNMRLKYQMTMARKMQNIVAFGTDAQVEFRESGKGMGMLGGGGKLKVGIQKDQKILKKRQFTGMLGGSGATSGLASSLAMTPLQGMELINPDLLERKVKEVGKESYFNTKSGFSTVLQLRGGSKPNQQGNGASTKMSSASNMIL